MEGEGREGEGEGGEGEGGGKGRGRDGGGDEGRGCKYQPKLTQTKLNGRSTGRGGSCKR